LYFKDDFFHLSRNFRLQKVGDLNWLINNFEFGLTASYVDEIMVILVKKNPEEKDYLNFFKNINELKKNIFIPITLGGGIDNQEIAKKFFQNGADKILVNTVCYEDEETINKISNLYGSQSISVMIDYKKNDGEIFLYSNCGDKQEKLGFKQHLENINIMNTGEIILNSIDRDGNGAGLDLEILKLLKKSISKPILLMGGAGKPEHLSEALQKKQVSGVITANLFNFLGLGLRLARKKLIQEKVNVVDFE
jgi:cyclase